MFVGQILKFAGQNSEFGRNFFKKHYKKTGLINKLLWQLYTYPENFR